VGLFTLLLLLGIGPGHAMTPSNRPLTFGGSSASGPGLLAPSTTHYFLWFNETGLPTGTDWSVTVVGTGTFSGSVSNHSTTSSVGFVVPAGFTGLFSVSPAAGYIPQPSSGEASTPASGAPVTVHVAFSSNAPAQVPVRFNETGLPSGTIWTVTLGTAVNWSATTSIGFLRPNGTTAPFTVGNVSGFTATPWAGNVTVLGPPVTVAVAFNSSGPVAMWVTASVSHYSEACHPILPVSAYLNATVHGGTPPYSYSWTFGDGSPNSSDAAPVHAYAQFGPYEAAVQVDDASGHSAGANVTVLVATPIACLPSNSPASNSTAAHFLGLPATEGYGLVVALAVVAVGAIVAGLRRWKGGSLPPPPRPGAPRS
jgi:PKD repeat protein